MLFENKPRAATDPALYTETMFEYLDRSARPPIVALRNVLESWWARYPAEHRHAMRTRLFGPNEGVQLSGFWELFLHESFIRADYKVEVSAGTPDFTLTGPGGRFHVEATTRFESPVHEAQQRREALLHDALDAIACGPWRFFFIEIRRADTRQPPSSRLRREIEDWASTLDFASTLAAWQSCDKSRFERFPTRVFTCGTWSISVEAFPLGPHPSRLARPRATLGWGSGEMVKVENEEPLREAIARKARECRHLDAPVIIAVLLARNFGHEHQIESALFGKDGVEISFNPSQLEVLETRPTRTPDGLWSAADGSGSRIAGVLAGVRFEFSNFISMPPTLWTNPRFCRSRLPVASSLPWHHRWFNENGVGQRSNIPCPAPFFGLAPQWPLDDTDG